MKKAYRSILLCCMLLFLNCNNADKKVSIDHLKANGIGFSISDQDANMVYNRIISALNKNSNIGIVAEVNHTTNAQHVNLNLGYTRTVYFGNPALGTPLMQDNQVAGLDLPQRITVYTNANGKTVVAYNSIDYIINRHGIDNAPTTTTIAGALSNLVSNSTESQVTLNTDITVENAGIVTTTSANDFDTTYSKIIDKLHNIDAITIMAELDHKANAQRVGMDLNNTKLIIFGNPLLGTPLMQTSRTMALDLPQKMLVYESTDGTVHISYNDPYFIAERHGIAGNEDQLKTISKALQTIAASGSATD